MKKSICFLFFKIFIFFGLVSNSFSETRWKNEDEKFFKENAAWMSFEKMKESTFFSGNNNFFEKNINWQKKDKNWFAKDQIWLNKEKENN